MRASTDTTQVALASGRSRPRPAGATTLALSPSSALTVLVVSGVVGSVGDLLLHDGAAGIGFPVWIALTAVAFVALLWRLERAPTREATLWLITAVGFASLVAWRDSGTLEFFDELTAICALLMAVVTVRDGSAGVFARRLRDTLRGVAVAVHGVVLGILPLAFREALAATRTGAHADRSRRAVRGAIISGAVVLVFGALLRSADPIFASLTSIADLDRGAIVRHAVFMALLTSLVAGGARTALLPAPEPRDGWNQAESRLEQSDVSAGLVTLNVLFGAFVLTQLGWFFGGEAFLRARTGLTAAQYAREGFFQMAFIVALVLPLLVAARAALPRGRATDRRFATLALPVVVLLGAMILSAALRMRLYVSYYGLSIDRFDTLAFMGWLAIVLGWFALTILRGFGRPFAVGAVVSGLGVLATLNIANPDEIVARANIARADRAAGPIDLGYLSSLSGEAAPFAIAAILHSAPIVADSAKAAEARTARCYAAQTLVDRWGTNTPAYDRSSSLSTWPTWNAGERRAVEALGRRQPDLERLLTTCNSRT